MGGLDDKQFEVFYGNRPIGGTKSIGQNLGTNIKVDIAHGASLRYMRTDDGRVLCVLNPAESENLKCPEEGIILEIIKEPAELSRKAKKHWKSFMAYMETTCIDGEPGWRDKLRTYCLRNFRSLIFTESTNPPRAKQFGATILKYVLTVGLSGFLILLVTWAREGIRDKEADRERTRLIETLERIQALDTDLGKEATSIRRVVETLSQDAQSGVNNWCRISEQLAALKLEVQEARESLKHERIEQGGADQPATAPELKPEGDEKPEPEAEARSQ